MTFTMYHATPDSNVNNILSYGLVPSVVFEGDEFSAIYMANSIEKVKDYAEQAYSMGVYNEAQWGVLKIQYDEFPDEVYPDLMWGLPGVYYVKVPIPHEHIVFVETFNVVSNPQQSPSTSYWHGTDRSDTIRSLITEGLRAGSSVSSIHGQATACPILLEYTNLQVDSVSYRPGDFRLLAETSKPLSVLVVPKDFGKGVRPVDEINVELAEKLGDLEVQGLSPEEVGAMSISEQYKVDKRLGELMTELDKSIDLETRGLKSEMGGEGVLRNVVEQASGTGVPVYQVERNEEGEINWSSKILIQ